MPENKPEKEIIFMPLAEERSLPGIPPGSPEGIAQELLRAEKEIAAETISVLKLRHENERARWGKMHGEKEQQMLELKGRLTEAEDRLKNLKERFEEERRVRLEQIRQSAREIEERRRREGKKWDVIAEEVRDFREVARKAEDRFLSEQEKVRRLQGECAAMERSCKELVRGKDEEIFELKQQFLGKEESWLKARSLTEEKITALQEQLALLQRTVKEERDYQGKVTEKKDSDLAVLQKGLQDSIILLNGERQKKEKAEERVLELESALRKAEEERTAVLERKAKEMNEWRKSLQEEQRSWEQYKQELKEREEALRSDTEEQLGRITRAMAIVEQQLAEEQRLRRESEQVIARKNDEIERLVAEKDGLVKEWRALLTSELETGKRQQAELIAEYEKVTRAKDEEIAGLRKEVRDLQAACSEEKKLFAVEREENERGRAQLQFLEGERQRIIEQLENKEKEWQLVLLREQELLQKQIEELRAKTEAQIQSREMEITRLNEDLSLLNGQLIESRQRFSLEKNENNNRLNRIQELEAQIRMMSEGHKQERLGWEEKLIYMQEQLEAQRKSSAIFFDDLDKRYKRDVQLLRQKNDELSRRTEQRRKKTSADEG